MKRYRFLLILVVLMLVTVVFAAPLSYAEDRPGGPLSPSALDTAEVGLLGQDGGAVYKVAVQGAVAYVVVGTRLVTLDISNPVEPRQLGEAQVLQYQAVDLAVAGDYAYTVTDAPGRAPNLAGYGQGMQVVDVRDPAAPSIVGWFNTQSAARRVTINGPYAYVLTEFEGLRIVDVSNPANPFEVGNVNAYGDFIISGQYAYTGGDFRVLDLSDPVNPVEVGYLDLDDPIRKIAINGDFAYGYGGFSGNFYVIDIHDLSNPVEVGTYDLGYIAEMTVREGYLYVANTSRGLRILDVHDPAAPFEVSVFDTEGQADDVAVIPGYALVAIGKGLQVIDVQDPAGPVAVGSFPSYYPYGLVAVHQSYAYATMSGGFNIIDISNPSDPVWVGTFQTPGRPQKMAFSGRYAFLALEAEGVWALDLSNPANPVEIGVYSTPGSAKDVAVQDDLVFVADGTGSGLRIIDVRNPALPEEVGHYLTPGDAVGVAVAGNYAYVGDGEEGLKIIDVSDPAQPSEAGVYQSIYGAYQVIIEENIAYITDEWGVRLVDVSDPAFPQGMGADDFIILHDFDVKDRFVYVTNEYISSGSEGGLKIIDARDPYHLNKVFEYHFPSVPTGIAVDGFYSFVGCSSAGLNVFVDTLSADYQLHLPMTHFAPINP